MILFPLSPVLLRICSPMAKRRLIHAVNEALHEEMERDDRVILYGEDVRIGLFGDTRGLFDKFGGKRVINTPISEVVMTGMAVGMAAAGYRPICHMMYGNFLYTGFDSIANQAAKLRYMTAGQLKLPLVYLASTGAGRSSGAQHSDAPYPGVMTLGGIKVVIPSTPADATGLMKASIREDNPVLFLLPTRRGGERSEEHTSELQSLMRISYAVYCLNNKTTQSTYLQNI